jgi:hypothetical protein
MKTSKITRPKLQLIRNKGFDRPKMTQNRLKVVFCRLKKFNDQIDQISYL